MTREETEQHLRDLAFLHGGPWLGSTYPGGPLLASLRDHAAALAMRESHAAHEEAEEREQAAWITGSETHRREAQRAREWAAFMAAACRGGGR